mmetsp:Transcript_43599/g.123389  ORF Transcript_43599/g.123389 Transcript_43599/m.123389 type:complete len:409 (+) Transcript_43599:66-1292(+)
MSQQHYLHGLMCEGVQGGRGDLGSFVRNVAFVGTLAAIYMAVSSGLITFNKFLMHDGRFPFAIFIGVMHMGCSFGFNFLLYKVCPFLYPSLTAPEQAVDLNRSLCCRVLLPISICFAAQLVLSNTAYLHSSVAFLQMMKQSNVVLVYIFSLALSLEQFDCKRTLVLLFIVGATVLTIHGELNFSYSGFCFQGASMLCEGMKLTLQSYSLAPTGRRLDALTYVMLVAPMVLGLLLALLVGIHLVWPSSPEAYSLPDWSVIKQFWPLLVGNGCLAFAMNVSHAFFIKNSSAVTFILTGVVMKDVMIVVAASIILGESLSILQVAGFVMQLLGILFWSLLKAKAAPQTAPTATEDAKVSEWEALRSDANDLGSDNNLSRPKFAGIQLMSSVSSESTMIPNDGESENSYTGV